MTIPPDFNDIESLADIVRREHNRDVKEWFGDTPDDDVTTSASRLKRACIIKDDDPLLVALQRQWLFQVTIGQLRSLQMPVYGIPVSSFAVERKHRPQVTLYFQQNPRTVVRGESPATGEISWRLMNETSTSITQSELTTLANRIKINFGANNGFVWEKGRIMNTYSDWSEGLQLQILAKSETVGEQVIKEVLKAHGGNFDATKLNVVRNQAEASRYPANPGNQNILGKSTRKPRERPIVDVRFRYATLALHGLARPVHLYDLTRTLVNPVVER